MKSNPQDLTHAPVLTDYDRANQAVYLAVLDAHAVGKSPREIALPIWGPLGPVDIDKIVSDHLQRAQWFTHTGYLLLLAEDPMPREQQLDELVASGRMSPEERNFLDSTEGEHYWPKPKQ